MTGKQMLLGGAIAGAVVIALALIAPDLASQFIDAASGLLGSGSAETQEVQ